MKVLASGELRYHSAIASLCHEFQQFSAELVGACGQHSRGLDAAHARSAYAKQVRHDVANDGKFVGRESSAHGELATLLLRFYQPNEDSTGALALDEATELGTNTTRRMEGVEEEKILKGAMKMDGNPCLRRFAGNNGQERTVAAWTTALRSALAGLALITLTACTGLHADIWHTMNLKEEVKLHDGRVIVVDRFYNLGGYPAIESHNRSPLDETLTFTLPASGKVIVWKTEFNDSPETNSLGPLLLDVVDGIPYLATSPAGCIAFNKWGRPNPPYVLFKYLNEAWQRIPLEAFPSMLVRSNLMSRPDSQVLKPYYTLEQVKAQMQGRNIAPEARSILREALPSIGSRCGEMVYDGKGGWVGIGWFRKQPSYQACSMYCEREKIPSQYCPCATLFNGK